MKRFLLIFFTLALCLPVFWGCGKEPDFYGVSVIPNGEASPELYQTTFHFDSYDEMIKDFRNYDLFKSSYTIQDLGPLLGEPYAGFVERVKSDKSFPHPMLDGKEIAYRNKEGFGNITFFVSELYDLPWIWYFPKVSTGENFYIGVTYLPEGVKDTSASDAIESLSPNSANVNNLGKQHKSIYERQIKLDGREVTALIMEYNDDTRSSIFFVYDDLLVSVRCDPTVWTNEWFARLSFE